MVHVTRKNLNGLISHLKSSASKRGIEFDLDVVDLNNLSFPITCPVLGIPLAFNTGGYKDNSYSIDRIDSTLGYTIDNLIVISFRANRLKSDATLDESKRIYDFYRELEGEKV